LLDRADSSSILDDSSGEQFPAKIRRRRMAAPGEGESEERKMQEFKKILILENEIEAQLLDSVLNEREIPHRIRSYHDSAYDGIYQAQKGWGRVDAPLEYKEEILSIYEDLPLQPSESDREDGEA
jgi:hypothetical protein